MPSVAAHAMHDRALAEAWCFLRPRKVALRRSRHVPLDQCVAAVARRVPCPSTSTAACACSAEVGPEKKAQAASGGN